MKTIYKTLLLGVFLGVVAAATPIFAQDVCADVEANAALYDKYLKNYKGPITEETIPQREIAVAAAKEYVEKYGACEAFKAQVDYLASKGPKLAKDIENAKIEIARNKRYTRFDKAMKSGNIPEVYASGEDILKFEPDYLDVIIVLAGVGLDEAAVKKNDTFNGKAIDYAKSALKKMESGTKSEKFGAYIYEYSSKENAIGWMNYTIGYIEFYRQNKKESGLNYFYKSTQVDSETKQRDFIYALAGDSYIEKAEVLNKEIIDLIKENEGKETYDIKFKLAISKGYADRAIDAYSRAYEVAKSNLSKETKADVTAAKREYVDNLYKTLTNLYKFRYDTVENPIPEAELPSKVNSHISTVVKAAFPSPSKEVEPVDPPAKEEENPESSTTPSTVGTSPTPAGSTVSTPNPSPAAKTSTNGASVKSDADRSGNKPQQR